MECADSLLEVLLAHAYLEALRVMHAVVAGMGPDSAAPGLHWVKHAARRGMELIDAGRWKQHGTAVNVPAPLIRQFLVMFARGNIFILEPMRGR